MTDYIALGATPAGEDCAQVGCESYAEKAIEECRRFRALLQKAFPLSHACYRIKSFPHDFGTYHEVCVVYDDNDSKAVEEAYAVEDKIPGTWKELELIAGGRDNAA